MEDDWIRTALFIDADNVNVEVAAEVIRRLESGGARRLQHRRAYGSLQKAQEFAGLCQQHALRFVCTTYAGTNGTDIALAIDAVELAINEPYDDAAIVTSDCDFLPLAVRLRELGCRVLGYGQEGKTSRDLKEYLRVYDEYAVIAASASSKPKVVAAKAPARKTTARSTPAAPAPSSASVAILRPPLDEELRHILEAVPALLEGQKVELGTAASLLRAAGLLAKNAPSTKLFKKYPERFELTPQRQPNKVLYKAAR